MKYVWVTTFTGSVTEVVTPHIGWDEDGHVLLKHCALRLVTPAHCLTSFGTQPQAFCACVMDGTCIIAALTLPPLTSINWYIAIVSPTRKMSGREVWTDSTKCNFKNANCQACQT